MRFPKWATAKQIDETTEYLLNNFKGDIKVPWYMVWPDVTVPFGLIPHGDFNGVNFEVNEASWNYAGKVLRQRFPYIKQSGVWVRAIIDKVVHDANHTTPRQCCLCPNKFLGLGNNPLITGCFTGNGMPSRCCDDCNFGTVIPARIAAKAAAEVCEGVGKS